MLQSIEELLQFFRQKYHTDIVLARESWQLDSWEDDGILVGMPREVGNVLPIGDLVFQQDGSFNQRAGDLIVVEDHPICVQGENFLLFNVCPLNEAAVRFIRNTIDTHIPKMARELRKKSRSVFLTGMLDTAKTRKTELTDVIREEGYQLDDLVEQINRLSHRITQDRKMLKFFERPEQCFRMQALRMFSELTKLVPNVYTSIRFDEGKIIGLTRPITIPYEGIDYHFEPYEVTYNLRDQGVQITGADNENNSYIHPHITAGGSICWGNIHGLALRLAGEMDLFGLFQLVDTFLSTYNENDPYQRIEKWDPNYIEDDEDEPYCRWCDESGHTIDECEWCWWCESCEDYCDHYEEDCPARQSEETEPTEVEEVTDDQLVPEPA